LKAIAHCRFQYKCSNCGVIKSVGIYKIRIGSITTAGGIISFNFGEAKNFTRTRLKTLTLMKRRKNHVVFICFNACVVCSSVRHPVIYMGTYRQNIFKFIFTIHKS
jgi:hypothetical protein